MQLRRLALIGSQLALLLPFVTVQDCHGAEPVTVTGVELLVGKDGWILAIPALFAAVLLVTSFRARAPHPGWRAFAAAVRALVAAICGLVVGGLPHVAFLFDTVRPQAGWFAVVGCWSLLYLEGLTVAAWAIGSARAPRASDLWDPVCRALRWVVLVIPWPVALLAEPDADEALIGAAIVTVAVSVPLWLALTGCVAGMRKREPWAAGWAPFVAAAISAAAALSALGAAA